MFFGPFSGLLFLGVLIALIVLLVRWLSGGGSTGGAGPSSTKTSLDILRERFARGEIDKDEFEERKKILGA